MGAVQVVLATQHDEIKEEENHRSVK